MRRIQICMVEDTDYGATIKKCYYADTIEDAATLLIMVGKEFDMPFVEAELRTP